MQRIYLDEREFDTPQGMTVVTTPSQPTYRTAHRDGDVTVTFAWTWPRTLRVVALMVMVVMGGMAARNADSARWSFGIWTLCAVAMTIDAITRKEKVVLCADGTILAKSWPLRRTVSINPSDIRAITLNPAEGGADVIAEYHDGRRIAVVRWVRPESHAKFLVELLTHLLRDRLGPGPPKALGT